jgi:two-component system, chemotaxis family, chemotaxis protein CheY
MALNILIVDDSSVTRRMISRALEMCGLEVSGLHEAGNGVEALSILRNQWVDLALVDVNMPEMNGEELLAPGSGSEHRG